MAEGNCNVTLNNNTIVYNSTAKAAGGGICTHGYGGAATFSGVNNIICFNTCIGSSSQYGSVYGGGSSNLTYSCILQDMPGTGNINDTPMFVNATTDNYNLQYGSPCIDTGDPSSPPDPDGTRADMGALYFDQLGFASAADPLSMFEVFPVSPNPFNTIVSISCNLPSYGNLRATIYDISGREVYTLTDRCFPSGFHSEVWDGRDETGQRMRNGIYFCRCEFDGAAQTKKLILIGDCP